MISIYFLPKPLSFGWGLAKLGWAPNHRWVQDCSKHLSFIWNLGLCRASSFHVIPKVQESKTNCTRTFEVSAYVTFTDIPRVRANCMDKPRVRWSTLTVHFPHLDKARACVYITIREEWELEPVACSPTGGLIFPFFEFSFFFEFYLFFYTAGSYGISFKFLLILLYIPMFYSKQMPE